MQRILRLRVKKVLHKLEIVNWRGRLERLEDHAEVIYVSHLTKRQIVTQSTSAPCAATPLQLRLQVIL